MLMRQNNMFGNKTYEINESQIVFNLAPAEPNQANVNVLLVFLTGNQIENPKLL